MLYDSPHAQEGLGQKTRRISHGPAIRHQQHLRPDLQLGRNGSEPSRDVERRFSLFCAADGRLKLFAPSLAPLISDAGDSRKTTISRSDPLLQTEFAWG